MWGGWNRGEMAGQVSGYTVRFDRMTVGEQQVEHAAERVQVCARVDGFACDQLGRHVRDCAHEVPRQCQPRAVRRAGVPLHHAEVGNLWLSVGVDQNVGRFEVSVDQAAGVEVLETANDAAQNRFDRRIAIFGRMNTPAFSDPLKVGTEHTQAQSMGTHDARRRRRP